MKKFKIISNIIIILLLASGAVPCIISSVDHAKNCYACSSHSSHPQIEIMLYGLVVLLAGVLFGISRIIPRLFKKIMLSLQRTPKAKSNYIPKK